MVHLLIALLLGFLAYLISGKLGADERTAVVVGILVGVLVYITGPWGM